MNNQNINPKTLKGKEVFNRALELMNKLTPINESVINASLEFVKRAPNGMVYTIIRENHKYFIKTTDQTEFKVSELDYIGGLKNKMSESYPSYEEALKHLNMKFQQMNEMYGIKRGLNLFEQDAVDTEDTENTETGTKEKKYKLKVSKDDTPSDEPSSEPMDLSTPEASSPEVPSVEDVPASPEGEMSPEAGEEGGGEMSPEAGEEGGEEMSPETGGEEDEDDIDIDEEEDPKKYIQKLTGRLGQKLRELSEVDPKLEKYVINSIISALHIDKMDKKDRMDVIRKFKKKKGMESIMKESFGMDEYYGMMSFDGPFNYEKGKGGFDESMDEELHGGQRKLDLNKNNKLDSEDFKMLRSRKNKKSSDEQWQGLAARAIGSAIGSYAASKMDSDENYIQSHSKSHRPLKFKKFELGMDEELHGGQRKLDLNKNNKLDSEDFRMLRAKKKSKSSDEQWQGLAARAIGSAIGGYAASKMGSDENEKYLDRERRIEDAINRVMGKKKDDDVKFRSAKDERFDHDIDEVDIEHLFMNSGEPEPEVIDPDTDIDTDRPLSPPVPRRLNPLDPGDPENDPMVRPKMGKKERDLTFESIIKKYRVRK